jgi:hypothetical protein
MIKWLLPFAITLLAFWLAVRGQGGKDYIYLIEPWIRLVSALAVSILAWLLVAWLW